jgi:ABC-type polysaccharide/polyol phosphate export permease
MTRRTTRVGSRTVRFGMVAGLVLFVILIGIAWRAQSVGWFLLFPLLLLGVLAAVALGVLAALRHV